MSFSSSDDLPTLKQRLRAEARILRDGITPPENLSALLTAHFLHAVSPRPDAIIAGYWPKGRELDPRGLMQNLAARGHRIVLPVVTEGTRRLLFSAWEEGGLTPGPYGLRQPDPARLHAVDPDIVLMPLLAFDDAGNRLGYGGGYYDATLADLRQRRPVTALGLAFSAQRMKALPHEPHDQKLDGIITEAGAMTFP